MKSKVIGAYTEHGNIKTRFNGNRITNNPSWQPYINGVLFIETYFWPKELYTKKRNFPKEYNQISPINCIRVRKKKCQKLYSRVKICVTCLQFDEINFRTFIFNFALFVILILYNIYLCRKNFASIQYIGYFVYISIYW